MDSIQTYLGNAKNWYLNTGYMHSLPVCLLILKLVAWDEKVTFFKRNNIVTISLKWCPGFLPCIVARLNCTHSTSAILPLPGTGIVKFKVLISSVLFVLGHLWSYWKVGMSASVSCWRWKLWVRIGHITQSWLGIGEAYMLPLND